jgi:DNA-binding NarL/FixJ family response regulator
LVGEAEDAEELEELLENSPVDLLIVDWMLPGLAEVGSFTELRQYHPSLIIITLSGRPELGREAIMAGADAFVSKIDPPDKLLSTMDYFKDQLEKSSMSL